MKHQIKIIKKIRLIETLFPVLLLCSFFIFSSTRVALSQATVKKVNRQSALDAFAAGKNDEALQMFTELLTLYPKDPLYKYYSGVCLVNLGKAPQKSLSYLTQAIREGGAVRSVPDDALFWLARAQQQSGKFNEAIRSFESFMLKSGKKTAREYGVQGFIGQCEEQKGKVEETVEETTIVASENLPVKPESIEIQLPDKQVNKTVPDTLPAEFDNILNNALSGNISIDSAVRKLTASDDIAQSRPVEAILPAGKTAEVNVPLTREDTIKKLPQEVFQAIKPTANQVSKPFLFEIKDNPDDIANQQIEINPVLPQGLIYRIQLAVFRNPPASSYFKGITPVFGFRDVNSGLTNYYAGMFRLHSDASKALLQVRNKGFRDAFINSLSDGKPVSAERAALLEKEWGQVPFMVEVPAAEQSADTLPPALLFRVEILRSLKPAPADQLENIKKLTVARGLDIETDEQGRIIYLSGSFISYESAVEYADILSRNGLRDAQVVARLGRKEIPVETAKQLFEIINN